MSVRETIMTDSDYTTLHKWVRDNKKKPQKCPLCKRVTDRIEWANKSGKYKRDLRDYVALCSRCHRRIDLFGHHKLCIRGHILTKKNTYYHPNSCIECHQCRRMRRKNYKNPSPNHGKREIA